MTGKPQWIGGQAVIEGVMMRSRRMMAVAFRRGDNSIGVHCEKLAPLAERFAPLGWPVLRGIVLFVESLLLGIRALNISAARAFEQEGEELTGWHTALMVLLGLGLGVALFFVLPTILARLLPPIHPVLLNLAEGLIRIIIFLAYIYLIARWKDVQRIFAYHGAEHKVISCYEDSSELSPANIRSYSTRHPRCGTSFILVVMIVSILLFSLFGWPELWQRILLRLALLPLVAGLSYEVVRFAARSRSLLAGLLTAPGIWIQKMTTREPDDQQVEVAISALGAVLETIEKPGRALEVTGNA